MKVSRIYPHIKTKGERRHEHEVAFAKKEEFKHPGSKTAKKLHTFYKKDNRINNK